MGDATGKWEKVSCTDAKTSSESRVMKISDGKPWELVIEPLELEESN